MSFIDMPGLSEVKDAYAAPEGLYDLCIVSAKVTEKDGKTNIQCILEIEGGEDYANVFHYVSLPGGDDDADKKKAKMLFARRFFVQFGIGTDDGIETEQMVGARATACKLSQQEWEGTPRNNFSANQLPQEA